MTILPDNSKGFNTENTFRTLELINTWISNVDSKASFALAFTTAILGLIFYNAGSMPSAFSHMYDAVSRKNISCEIVFPFISVVGLYISFFLSISFFFLALKGTTKSGSSSILFFGTIAGLSQNDFKAKIFNMNDKALQKALAEQIHTNSIVCAKKFKWYNTGLRLLVLASMLCVVCLLFGWL